MRDREEMENGARSSNLDAATSRVVAVPMRGSGSMTIRTVVAVLTANVAASCLFVLYILLRFTLDDPGHTIASAQAMVGILLAILYGTLATVFLKAFPVSLLLALVGQYFHWRSLLIYLAGGIITGMSFALLSYDWNLPGGPLMRPIFPLSITIGAICGWIYWRIAIRGSARAPVP